MPFKKGNHFQNAINVPKEDDVVPVCHAAHVCFELGPIAPERSRQRCEIFTPDDKLLDEAIGNPGTARRFLQIRADRRKIVKRLV